MDAQNTFQKTVAAELAFLRDKLKEFGNEFPDVSDALLSKSDPTLARLLEGFAYLTAKLQCQLDQSCPALSAALLSYLWHDALSPIPSMTIVEATPCQHPVEVDLDSTMVSQTKERAESNFQFSALRQTILYPIKLSDCMLQNDCLQLSFEKMGQFKLSELAFIDFYIDTATISAMTCYLAILSALEIQISSGGKTVFIPIDQCQPIIDDFANGLALMQRYFLFPEQFHFIRLSGLSGLLDDDEQFTIELRLPENTIMHHAALAAIKINCLPICNAYRLAADPISAVPEQVDYPLTFSENEADQECVLLNLISLTGLSQLYGREVSFLAQADCQHNTDYVYYCHQASAQKQLSVKLPLNEQSCILSPIALVSDGASVRKRVRVDQILRLKEAYCLVKVLIRPTFFYHQNACSSQYHLLIELLQRNWQQLTSVSALRIALQYCNIASLPEVKKIINAIVSVKAMPLTQMQKGLVLHVVQWQFKIDRHQFQSLGDLHCFQTVLQQYVTFYRPMNIQFAFEFMEG